jgi:hypothetical protein
MEPFPITHLMVATAVFVVGGLVAVMFDISPVLVTIMIVGVVTLYFEWFIRSGATRNSQRGTFIVGRGERAQSGERRRGWQRPEPAGEIARRFQTLTGEETDHGNER